MKNLFEAVKTGKIEEVIKAIKTHQEHSKIPMSEFLNQKDKDACTPLHRASENGNLDIVMRLIFLGAQIDALDSENKTPSESIAIDLAWQNEHKNVASLLANHHKIYAQGVKLPLIKASREGDADQVIEGC